MDTRELFGDVDGELPPSRVDVGLAMRDGQRTVRRRRVVASGTAGLAVLAVFTAGALITQSGGLPSAAVPGAGQGAGATPGVVAADGSMQVPERLDPLVRYAGWGWLPPGLSSYRATRSTDVVYMLLADKVTFRMHAKFRKPPGATTPAPDVNHRTAMWLDMGSQTVSLYWQLGPDAWAGVSVDREFAGSEAQGKEMALRIAGAMQFGPGQRLDLPANVPAAMDGMPLREIMVRRTPDSPSQGSSFTPWSVSVEYGPSVAVVDPPAPSTQLIRISIMPYLPVHAEKANTTVDGFRAATGADPGASASWLNVYDVSGYTVAIDLKHKPENVATAVFRQLTFRPYS
ncbi:hypothetical protein [Longispora albida]|uniref:hypothetical protein n=1 Tax=Longispora albida TaxID=203523 RepID=UPI00035D48E2|nr:hypothetical protein [Longispora albida]